MERCGNTELLGPRRVRCRSGDAAHHGRLTARSVRAHQPCWGEADRCLRPGIAGGVTELGQRYQTDSRTLESFGAGLDSCRAYQTLWLAGDLLFGLSLGLRTRRRRLAPAQADRVAALACQHGIYDHRDARRVRSYFSWVTATTVGARLHPLRFI